MKFIFPILFFSPLSLWAQQAPLCQDLVERHGSVQLQQTVSGDNTKCYLSIHSSQESGLVYRDYLMTSEGELMVFNSFGAGPDSEFTGAREFFMFPRTNNSLSYVWNDEARRLEITDRSGSVFYFDYETAQLTAISNATVKVSSKVVAENRGGVEISNFKGLLLDLGFTKGHAPSQVSSGSAVFKDQNGQTCRVKNSEVFKYTSDGDAIFKYSDKDLGVFLQKKCPQLKPMNP